MFSRYPFGKFVILFVAGILFYFTDFAINMQLMNAYECNGKSIFMR